MEDMCVLDPALTYTDVQKELGNSKGGVFGYGRYDIIGDNIKTGTEQKHCG